MNATLFLICFQHLLQMALGIKVYAEVVPIRMKLNSDKNDVQAWTYRVENIGDFFYASLRLPGTG